jgi:hypothetical protein
MALDLKKIREGMIKALDNFDWVSYNAKQEKKEEIRSNRINKIYIANKDNMASFIEKVINKYESTKYVNKEMHLGYQAREDLYWVLLSIASRYGEEVSENEKYEKHINMFTSCAYVYEGYIIQRMDGQGSVVRIDKINENI